MHSFVFLFKSQFPEKLCTVLTFTSRILSVKPPEIKSRALWTGAGQPLNSVTIVRASDSSNTHCLELYSPGVSGRVLEMAKGTSIWVDLQLLARRLSFWTLSKYQVSSIVGWTVRNPMLCYKQWRVELSQLMWRLGVYTWHVRRGGRCLCCGVSSPWAHPQVRLGVAVSCVRNRCASRWLTGKAPMDFLPKTDSRSAGSNSARQAPLSMGSSRQECWSGLHCLLQGIFPTQESNPSLLHCRRILFHLSHQGSPEGHF